MLWRSYKDLMQTAATLIEQEIGCLFQCDSQFEDGLIKWGKRRPAFVATFGPYAREQRRVWQNELGSFRNYLEHKDQTDPSVYEYRYTAEHAEYLFQAAWRTIADILAMLTNLHLPSGTTLMEIPLEQRQPLRPRRFCFAVQGFLFVGTQASRPSD